MAEDHGDLLDRTLRWMGDNLQGAYTAKYPPEHAKAGQYCVNSGTCILVCCYINALECSGESSAERWASTEESPSRLPAIS
jgi:hypothetical protein